jgi:hypothetical protein
MAYGSKIVFGNGEGLDFEDLRDSQDFQRRALVDEVASRVLGGDDMAVRGDGTSPDARDSVSALRPHGRALCPRIDSGTLDINYDAGLVLFNVITDELDPASLVPENRLAYSNGGTLSFSAPGGGFWRRDLIQARIVDEDEATVPRDFEDGSSRVKTSQSYVKRSNWVVEVEVKQGATQGTEAAADLLVNEPAPDSGWFRIASIRVDEAESALAQNDLWDWRQPMGYGHNLVMAGDWTHAPANFAVQGADANYLAETGSGGDVAWFSVMGGGPYRAHGGAAVAQGATVADLEDHRRLVSIGSRSRMESATGLALELSRYDLIASTTISQIEDLEPALTIAASENDDDLYISNGFPDSLNGPFVGLPVWANGRRSPAFGFQQSSLILRWTSPSAGGLHYFKNVIAQFWGGL